MMITASDTIVGHIDVEEQRALVSTVRQVARAAPLTLMPGGMTVKITNAGKVGWWAWGLGDYDYISHQPNDGSMLTGGHVDPWPPIPDLRIDIFRRYADDPREPDCGHVVWYAPGTKLGLHRDKTERDTSGSVVTVSLGDPATWAVESQEQTITRATLQSGDVTLLEGPTRHLRHAIERVHKTEQQHDQGSLFASPVLDAPGRLVVSIRSGAGG